MSGIGKSTETESRSVVARGQEEEVGRGFPMEMLGNEVVVTAAQHCECAANH